MLGVVIAGEESTEDAGFVIGSTVDIDPVSVGGVGAGMKGVVEGRILEALTGAGIGGAEEVLIGASPDGVGDADDDTNGAGTDKVAAAGGPKGEVCV